MSMAAHKLERRMGRFLGKLIEQKLLNATPVIIHYVNKPSPADPAYDPNVESSYPSSPDQKQVTVTGLWHVVSARTTQRQFTEIQTGDVILTFEAAPVDQNGAAVDLNAMDQVRFEFDGKLYVQQAVGKELGQYWDAVLGGYPVSMTLLLRLSN